MIISLYCLCSGSTDTALLFMSFSLLDLDSRRLVEQDLCPTGLKMYCLCTASSKRLCTVYDLTLDTCLVFLPCILPKCVITSIQNSAHPAQIGDGLRVSERGRVANVRRNKLSRHMEQEKCTVQIIHSYIMYWERNRRFSFWSLIPHCREAVYCIAAAAA